MSRMFFVSATVVLVVIFAEEAWSSRQKRLDMPYEGSISLGLSVSANFTLTSDFNATCQFFERAHSLRQNARLRVLQLTSKIIQTCDTNLTLNENIILFVNILKTQAEDTRYLANNCNTYWKEQHLLRGLNELLQIIAQAVQVGKNTVEKSEGEVRSNSLIILHELQNLTNLTDEALSETKKSILFHVTAVHRVVTQIKTYWQKKMEILLETEQKVILKSNVTFRDVISTDLFGRRIEQSLIYAVNSTKITFNFFDLFSNSKQMNESFITAETEILTQISKSLEKIKENSSDISFEAQMMLISIEKVLERSRNYVSHIQKFINYQITSTKILSNLITMFSNSTMNIGILNDIRNIRQILSQLNLDELDVIPSMNRTSFGYLLNIKNKTLLKEDILELEQALQQLKIDDMIVHEILTLNESDAMREWAQNLSAYIQRQIANITTVLDDLKPLTKSVRDKINNLSTQLTTLFRSMLEEWINFIGMQNQQCQGALQNNGILEMSVDDFNSNWKRITQDCVETGLIIGGRLQKIKEEMISSERLMVERVVKLIFSNLRNINENTSYFQFEIMREFTYFMSDMQERIADISKAVFTYGWMYKTLQASTENLLYNFHVEIDGMVERARQLQIILIQIYQTCQQIQQAQFPSNISDAVRSVINSILLLIENGGFRNIETYQDLIEKVDLVFSMLEKLKILIQAVHGQLPNKILELWHEIENLQHNGLEVLDSLRNFIMNRGEIMISLFSSSFQKMREVMIKDISLITQRNKVVLQELNGIASSTKEAFRSFETIIIIENETYSSELQNIVEISESLAADVQREIISLRIDSLSNYSILSRMEETIAYRVLKTIQNSSACISSYLIQIPLNNPQKFMGLFTYLKEFKKVVILEIYEIIFNVRQIINVFESQNINVRKLLFNQMVKIRNLIVEEKFELLQGEVQQLFTVLKSILPDIKSAVWKLQGDMQDKAKLSLAYILKWMESGTLDTQNILQAWFLDFFFNLWELVFTLVIDLERSAQIALEYVNEMNDQSEGAVLLLRMLAQRCISAGQAIIKNKLSITEYVSNTGREIVNGIMKYILEHLGTFNNTEKLDTIITHDLDQRLMLTYLLKPVEYIMNIVFFFRRALSFQMQVIDWRNIPETINSILQDVSNQALQMKQILLQKIVQVISQFSQLLTTAKDIHIPLLPQALNLILNQLSALKENLFQTQEIKTLKLNLQKAVSLIPNFMLVLPGAGKNAIGTVKDILLSIIENLTHVLNETEEFRNTIQHLVSNSHSIIYHAFSSIRTSIRELLQYVNSFIDLIKSILVVPRNGHQINFEGAHELRNILQHQIGPIESAFARIGEEFTNFNTSFGNFESIFEGIIVETLTHFKLNAGTRELTDNLGQVIEINCEHFAKVYQDLIAVILTDITYTCEIALNHFLMRFRINISGALVIET